MATVYMTPQTSTKQPQEPCREFVNQIQGKSFNWRSKLHSLLGDFGFQSVSWLLECKIIINRMGLSLQSKNDRIRLGKVIITNSNDDNNNIEWGRNEKGKYNHKRENLERLEKFF